MTPRLLFVDHSFHRKTRATDFLRALLRERFEVVDVWDDRWSGGEKVTAARLDAHDPDVVLFFQSLLRPVEFAKLRCVNRVWVPMRDGVRYESKTWAKLASLDVKVLSFCAEVHAFAEARGARSLLTPYAPEPAAPCQQDALRVLFWQRRAAIDPALVCALLRDQPVDELVFRAALDPGETSTSTFDGAPFPVRRVDGWLEKDEYDALLRSASVVISPRLLEGIGQTFLEAMAQGSCVIAPDRPTMNEYVTHGVTGLLFDPEDPAPLDLTRWRELGAAGRDHLAAVRAQWVASREAILEFVAAPPPVKRSLWSRFLGR